MYRIVGYLDRLKASSGASDLTAAAKAFAIKHAGKGVVVIISDFLDKRGYEPALRYLLARNMDIYVVHVLAREEVEPELVGDLRLVDAEDDDVAEITVSAPLLRRYKDNLNSFVGGLKEWCTKRGITYIFTTNQNPFDKLILNYLRERGLVRSKRPKIHAGTHVMTIELPGTDVSVDEGLQGHDHAPGRGPRPGRFICLIQVSEVPGPKRSVRPHLESIPGGRARRAFR